MEGIEPIEKPRMVKSHDVHLDADYAEWIADLKYRYRSAQVKASVRVNSEKLLLIGNWGVTWCKRRRRKNGVPE